MLTCIANLSNDAVFTPPEFANQMLDTLEQAWAEDNEGASIWADPTVTFLDPFTKSGVFLREITRRLVDGLEDQIPDLQERVDHVLTKQVFGIATETLTALMSRRSVYCSKFANGEHSIAKSLDTEEGNIWFERTEHTWVGGTEWIVTTDVDGKEIQKPTNGKCVFCNASQRSMDRGSQLETHAYAFIHTDDLKARIAGIFGADMQFDVIVGNPPYQMESDGGTRDIPLYNRFVNNAKLLEPRFVMMIIPSRWMASGLGLSEFRKEMLTDDRIRVLVDYPNSADVFPGVDVKGGVCYFLWDRENPGLCRSVLVRGEEVVGPVERSLDAHDVFVRDSRSLDILNRVSQVGERSINEILSVDKQFGWTSNFRDFDTGKRGEIPLYYNTKGKRLVGWIKRDRIDKSPELIDKWKVMVPQAGSDGGQRIPDSVLGRPFIVSSPSVCTQTYLFFYLDSKEEVESLASYLCSKLLRFLVSLRKITQHATRSTYEWVPMQTWDRIWTDEALYEKYGITEEEQAFIEKMIRPMELDRTPENGAADE